MPGPESVGTAFVEAAQLGMEDSGKQATARDGHCVIISDEPMREVRT